MQSLARPPDTAPTTHSPLGEDSLTSIDALGPRGQRAMPWAPAQLGLDRRAYAPPAPSQSTETDPNPKGEPSLGTLHGLCLQTPGERRWERQRTMWDLLGPSRAPDGQIDWTTGARVAKCRKVRLPTKVALPALRRSQHGSWDITGTVRCGSAHACPMCAWARARELTGVLSCAVDRHLASAAAAPDVWMMTLTQPHEAGDGYRRVVDRLVAAWRRFSRSREWREWRARWGVRATVRVWDSTIGGRGLHGHWHVGLWLDHAAWWGTPIARLDDSMRDIALHTAAEELRDVWVRVSVAAGVPAAKSDAMRELGLHIGRGTETAAYLAKWGVPEELGLSPAKSGRTHWELLDLAGAGDMRAGVQFCEYYEATQGLSVVTGVSQLRRLLGIDDDVLTAHIVERERLRELQAELEGNPIELVEPLIVNIGPWYWGAAIGAGWHAVCRVADAADRAGADVQAAVDAYLEARALGP